jgi:hypothetical protein
MKSHVKRWCFDFALIATLTGIAGILLPVVAALFADALSMRTAYVLPRVIVGCFLGVVTSLAIRHAIFWVATLPALLLLIVNVIPLCFGSDQYAWGKSRQDMIVIVSWAFLVATDAICAWFTLKCRKLSQHGPNTTVGIQ